MITFVRQKPKVMKTITANVPIIFLENLKKYHKEYNVKIVSETPYKNKWVTVVVSGEDFDLRKLNRKCIDETYLDDII